MPEQLKPGAFRVFDTEAKEYKDPDEYWMNGRGALKILYYGNVEPDVPGAADAGPRWIAERWTGLYDRDGKPVYEGDIVFYGGGPASNPENVLTVKYHQENGFTGLVLQDYWGWNMGMMSILTHRPTIGTVHDSPETLEAAARAVSQ